MRRHRARLLVLLAFLGAAAPGTVVLPAEAGEARIMATRIVKIGENAYEFHVRVGHIDDSWDHFVDRWEVIGPDGKVAGTRILRHPHIGERTFARSLRPVIVPEGTEHVILRAHDKIHGYGREKLTTLPTDNQRDTGWR